MALIRMQTCYNNNNNNPICKAPECQKTSVVHQPNFRPMHVKCFYQLCFLYSQQSATGLSILLLFWHAPLKMHSTICRHQPAQRAVLSQIDCFVQCEIVGSQILLDGVQPHDTGMPWWSVPVLWWGSR